MDNLLLEGRYDKVTTELSREITSSITRGVKRLQTRISLFTRTYIDVSVYLHYDDEKEPQVYGATYIKGSDIRKHYTNKRIVLHVDVPKTQELRNQQMTDIIPEIKNIVRHEIEHIAQSKFKEKERTNFFSNKRRYPEDIEYWEYLTEPYEVEAYVHGLYKKSKTLRQPLNILFDSWWSYLSSLEGVHPDEVQAVKKAWTDYAKKHLPQTPLRKWGYIDEPNVESVETPINHINEPNGVVESQRVVGFKYRKPEVNALVNIEAADSGNIKYKLMDLLDRMDVNYNSVTGGGSKHNSYSLDLNLYDEKEVQTIINDLIIKLMLDNVRVTNSNYHIKEPKLTESEEEFEDDEMGGFKIGDEVRMTNDFKNQMISNSPDHIEEFGNSIGVIEGLVDYNNVGPNHPNYNPDLLGPELNVRWKTENGGLRYGYDPAELELVVNIPLDIQNTDFFKDLYTESVLFEAKKDTLRSKWNSIPEETFNQLVDADPSPTKKYSEWMLNTFLNGGYPVDKVIETIQKFNQSVNRINNEFIRKGIDAFENSLGIDIPTKDVDIIMRAPKDINSYAGLGILNSILSQIEAKKTKREEKLVGAEKIFEDDNFIVILPKTEEGSCHYGAGTKWCTAAKGSNQFNNYSKRGTLYYIIFKANSVLNPERKSKLVWQKRLPVFEKIARFIPNGLDYGVHGEFYNAQDAQMEEDAILNQFFGITWTQLGMSKETVSNIPTGTQGFYDSWYRAWTAIDTHYARNGMQSSQNPYDYDEWDEDMNDGWDDDDMEDPNN